MLMVADVQDIIKRHQAQIITSLKDPDIRLTLLSCSMLNLSTLFLLIHLHNKEAICSPKVSLLELLNFVVYLIEGCHT